jgi:hypothetical protein
MKNVLKEEITEGKKEKTRAEYFSCLAVSIEPPMSSQTTVVVWRPGAENG